MSWHDQRWILLAILTSYACSLDRAILNRGQLSSWPNREERFNQWERLTRNPSLRLTNRLWAVSKWSALNWLFVTCLSLFCLATLLGKRLTSDYASFCRIEEVLASTKIADFFIQFGSVFIPGPVNRKGGRIGISQGKGWKKKIRKISSNTPEFL